MWRRIRSGPTSPKSGWDLRQTRRGGFPLLGDDYVDHAAEALLWAVALVDAGVLDAESLDEQASAFDEAVTQLWRKNALMTAVLVTSALMGPGGSGPAEPDIQDARASLGAVGHAQSGGPSR